MVDTKKKVQAKFFVIIVANEHETKGDESAIVFTSFDCISFDS